MMKRKMIGTLVIAGLIAMAVLSGTAEANAVAWITASDEYDFLPKNTFNTDENVYAVGYLGYYSFPDQGARLYVVDHKDTWSNGDPLVDVSGGYEAVSHGDWGFVYELPWEAPLTAGTYDLVLDLDVTKQNGVWSDITDPYGTQIVDPIYTFEVTDMVADLWTDINVKLDELIDEVNAADMPNIIKQRLLDKLVYAKELKDNAKEECEAGNFVIATKKLGVAKNQVESFASMVRITRRISPADKASFLADAAEIKGKINELIEYIETEHKC